MAKCRKLGVACPCVYLIDINSVASNCDKILGTTTLATSISCNDDTTTIITSNKDIDIEMEASKSYRIYMEYIRGITVKQLLWTLASKLKCKSEIDTNINQDVDINTINTCIHSYMNIHGILAREIGRTIAMLHSAKVVHGDLTTSNIMIRMKSSSNGNGNVNTIANTNNTDTDTIADVESIIINNIFSNENEANIEIVIIDFGLGKMQANVEDMAVDLYVLERAYASTHPNMESVMSAVLNSYELYCSDGKSVMAKLEAVRMRGRKRDMMG